MLCCYFVFGFVFSGTTTLRRRTGHCRHRARVVEPVEATIRRRFIFFFMVERKEDGERGRRRRGNRTCRTDLLQVKTGGHQYSVVVYALRTTYYYTHRNIIGIQRYLSALCNIIIVISRKQPSSPLSTMYSHTLNILPPYSLQTSYPDNEGLEVVARTQGLCTLVWPGVI